VVEGPKWPFFGQKQTEKTQKVFHLKSVVEGVLKM